MSSCYIHANLVKIHQLVHETLCSTRTFWLKFGSLSPAKTLKNRSRSPKPNLLFIMSQCYIHANLVEICRPVHKIWCIQAFFGLNLAKSRSDLENLSRSPKPKQLFIMSQCYIHANFHKIHPPTRKCHADADANRIRTKNNMCPSSSVGDIISWRLESWNAVKWEAILAFPGQ